jgi:hypothetical protein
MKTEQEIKAELEKLDLPTKSMVENLTVATLKMAYLWVLGKPQEAADAYSAAIPDLVTLARLEYEFNNVEEVMFNENTDQNITKH